MTDQTILTDEDRDRLADVVDGETKSIGECFEMSESTTPVNFDFRRYGVASGNPIANVTLTTHSKSVCEALSATLDDEMWDSIIGLIVDEDDTTQVAFRDVPAFGTDVLNALSQCGFELTGQTVVNEAVVVDFSFDSGLSGRLFHHTDESRRRLAEIGIEIEHHPGKQLADNIEELEPDTVELVAHDAHTATIDVTTDIFQNNIVDPDVIPDGHRFVKWDITTDGLIDVTVERSMASQS